MMMVIPETRRAHYIWYLRFYINPITFEVPVPSQERECYVYQFFSVLTILRLDLWNSFDGVVFFVLHFISVIF